MFEKPNLKYTIALLLVLALTTVAMIGQTPEAVRKSQEAKTAMESGDFDRAVVLYQELLAEMPDVDGLRMNLGMAYFMQGSFAKAAAELESLVKSNPQIAPAWQFLGTAQLELGRLGPAIDSLKRYQELVPQDIKGLEILADALFRAQNLEEARLVSEELVQKDPKNARGWYELGRIYESLAGKAFESLSQTAPESGYLFALIADSKMSEQQYDTAFFFYRKALEATPELRGIHVAISRIYQIKGNEDWAKIEQEKELKQGIPDCEKEKEVCSYLQGEFHDLLKIVHSKKSPEAYYWQSQAFNQLALAALSQLAKLPSSVEVHSLRAEVNRNLGRHWDSVAELEKALQLEPENIYLKQELVISKYLNRDYDGSRSLAFDLMKVLPPSAQLNFIVGDGYLYQQSVEQAIPYLEKAVKLQPDYLAAHSSLGRAYMTIGNAESAIPHLHQAMSLDENGDLHYQLARAYQRMGDREKAREAMQKYQELRNSSRIEERELQETVKITPP